jgi:hypothetical protein
MWVLRPTMSFPNSPPMKLVSLSLQVSIFPSLFENVAKLAASQQTAGDAAATGLAPGILASVSLAFRLIRAMRY